MVFEAGTWEKVCTESASHGGTTERVQTARAFVIHLNFFKKSRYFLKLQDGKYIYSCGGYDKDGSIDTATNECYSLEFSLNHKKWNQITSMAEKRYGASADLFV